MMRKICAAAALAGAVWAQPAFAVEHTVLLLGDSYFPEVIYVQAGDSIRFTNATEVAQSATATDGTWDSGSLTLDQAYVLPVTAEMTLDFQSSVNTLMVGSIVIGSAPQTEATE